MPERSPDLSETVSVLIPVFNDDGQLAATLRSLDAQGVPVVVVIVDDGSRVPLVVHEEPSRDREIVVLRHDVNRGIEHALNTGLDYIGRRGIPYVARLDNGDHCAPGRLWRQRSFLDAHPSIDLVGCAVEWRDDDGRSRFTRVFPTTHDAIVRALHHTTALIHPAVMFRTSVVRTVGMYSAEYPAAEDLEFFCRIARRHRVANLEESLLIARFDPAGVSIRRRREQLRSTLRIQLGIFQPTTWVSYYGVLKTLGRYAVPYAWIVALKRLASRRRRMASA
jgi:glycosyltransferase involved in cell wall biosynthesis